MVCSFIGDTDCRLFKIQDTLNQHGYHSTSQRHAILPGLSLVGPAFVFQPDNDPNTPPGSARAI